MNSFEDSLSESERRELEEAILRGIEDGEAGREMDADEFLQQLLTEP